MVAFAWLILCAHIIKALATETATLCPAARTTDKTNDGFAILKESSLFRLTETSFSILSNNTFRCITSKATNRDDSQRKVTLETKYMVLDTESWEYLRQTFVFQCGAQGYDIMTTTTDSEHALYYCAQYEVQRTRRDRRTVPEATSAHLLESHGASCRCKQQNGPAASYKFLSAEPTCAILQYLGSSSSSDDHNQPQEQQSIIEGTQEKKGDCLLWVKGASGEPSDVCRTRFSTLCNHARHSFSQAGCTKPASEAKARNI
ncbi:hypothetical protein V5799_020425 [Amblyomma americanum]|uniref:Lipocalin n=1 Tax=Amblyomma americanum TaxID=6943 RepID=A0AAQ4ETV6_AMBAM